MIRATLDVNVLASGFPAEAGIPAELIDRWTDLAYELVISEHILEGLARTWQKPYYQSRYSSERVQRTLSLLRSEATLVIPTSTVRGVAEDEEDDLMFSRSWPTIQATSSARATEVADSNRAVVLRSLSPMVNTHRLESQ